MKTRFPLVSLGLAVLGFLVPVARADEEQDLLGVLRSGAGVVEKCEACRQLRVVGTVGSVPLLAALLGDERIGHAARHALEGLPFPEAGKALREAAAGASGAMKSGLMDSLGWRRDPAALALLISALADPDVRVSGSAASALGRFGGRPAAEALRAASEAVPPEVRPVVLESLLRCAEQQLAAGDTAGAGDLAAALLKPSEPAPIRRAAHVLRLRAGGAAMLDGVLSSLSGTDPDEQMAALQVAGRVRDERATREFGRVLPGLSSGAQIVLLAVLRERGDAAAVPAVTLVARGSDPLVRSAAVATLGTLGDEAVVPDLLASATSPQEGEQSAGRDALVELRRGPVAEALVSRLASATPAVRAELIRALTARGEKAAVPTLLRLAGGSDVEGRRAAFRALSGLVDESHAGELVDFLAGAGDVALLDEARGLFESIADRPGGASQFDVAPILRAIPSATLPVRAALFLVASRFPDTRFQPVFRAALAGTDAGVRMAAARALCETRDVALLPDLLGVARTATNDTMQVLALRGVARLATDESATLPRERRVEYLTSIVPLTRGTDERRLLLSSLVAVPDWTLLGLVQEWARLPELQDDAEAASVKMAGALAAENRARAEGVVRPLVVAAASPAVREVARGLLARWHPAWVSAGPYRIAGKPAQDLFDQGFPPENPGAEGVRWTPAPGRADPKHEGEIDLLSVAGGDHCVVYARTRIHSPEARDVTLLIGTDDGIKLWLNGKVVHANNAVRGLTPDEDRVKARLQAGWNEVLAKITQHTAGCGMAFRVVGDDGQALPGLRLDPGNQEPATR